MDGSQLNRVRVAAFEQFEVMVMVMFAELCSMDTTFETAHVN